MAESRELTRASTAANISDDILKRYVPKNDEKILEAVGLPQLGTVDGLRRRTV